MKESQFGFEYSWADLKPIRVLMVTIITAQLLGGAVGLLVPRFPGWFESFWFGGAVATFPAFLLGAVIQAQVRPGSLSENKVMVRRLGLIAALLTAIAFAMPVLGFGDITGTA
jgi:hypothetical protein